MTNEELTLAQPMELEQEAREANAKGIDAYLAGKYVQALVHVQLEVEIRRRLHL